MGCSGWTACTFTQTELVLRTFFGGNFQTATLPSFCQEQVLKNYTAKVFYQILEKRLKIRRRQFCVLCRLGCMLCSSKKRIFSGPNSVMWLCEFMKTIPHHGYFPRKGFDYFWELYFFSEPNNYCFDRSAPGQLSK